MKMIQNIVLTLVTVLTFTLSSCNPASVPDVTPDEIAAVVATTDELTTTALIEETTAAVTEETTVPETTAPEVTEPTKVQEPEKTENKPVNNSSSDKQQNNSNNSGNQTANKPSNNTSSGSNSSSSSTNKKPAETKPAEPKPVVITDDTIISYEEICTDNNMKKVTEAVNSYFISMGFNYNESKNRNNSGWFFVQMPMLQYDELSVNKLKSMVIDYFNKEVEANLLSEQWYSDGETEYYYTNLPSDYKFRCYYELTSAGYYNIYFCYG